MAGKGHLAALSRRRPRSVSAERFVGATVATLGCEVTGMEPNTVGASSGVVMARVSSTSEKATFKNTLRTPLKNSLPPERTSRDC